MKLFRKKEKYIVKEVLPDTIYSPLCGIRKSLEEVDDMVFSSKMMGDGIAIEPSSGFLYSPVNGTISLIFPTKHVIGIQMENQMNVILHLGIDTVELKGKGFYPQVKEGDVVTAGQLLMKFDLALINETYTATTMIVMESNGSIQLEKQEYGEIEAGEELMKIKRV